MPLSAKQMEYLALAWQCFDSEPKIDYAKFAQVAGLASPASARELMRVTKNKLKDEYGALSSGLQGSNAGPRTPGKKKSGTPVGTPGSRKRGRKEAGEGDGEGTPVSKKTKKGSANGGEDVGKKANGVVKEEPVEGSEGEEEPSFF